MSEAALDKEHPGEKNALRESVRKTAIVLCLLALLLPVFLINVGLNADGGKWPGPFAKLNQPIPSLQALLLCQQWTLFSSIAPFNFTFQLEVETVDGERMILRDLEKERAGKWQTILFHNEPKLELNLYSEPESQRRYLEYLVRTNGIDPAQIARRTIYLRYQNIYPRDQAAQLGTYFGEDAYYTLDNY